MVLGHFTSFITLEDDFVSSHQQRRKAEIDRPQIFRTRNFHTCRPSQPLWGSSRRVIVKQSRDRKICDRLLFTLLLTPPAIPYKVQYQDTCGEHLAWARTAPMVAGSSSSLKESYFQRIHS